MSRWKVVIAGFAAALCAASSMALGADAAPAAAGRAASAQTDFATASATSSAPLSAASPAKLVCLSLSMRCFALTPKSTSSEAPSTAAALDLRAPDIARLVPRSQLIEKLPDPYEAREAEESVQVEGTRVAPYVPLGLMAFPWAIRHPTQAWRLFLPVPAGQAR